MSQFDSYQELGNLLSKDLYAQSQPQIDAIKQVIDTLKDRVQPLAPIQLQVIGYLEHLANRPIHKTKDVYKWIVDLMYGKRMDVAKPGFFIRIIEALTGGTKYVPHETMANMSQEREGKK